MSRTDKTNPAWVKIMRREGNRKPWHICHNHNKHADGCHPIVILPETRGRRRFINCEMWPRYNWQEHNHIYGRRPHKKARRLLGFERSNRARLRKLRRDWLLEPIPQDIDSTLWAPRRRCQSHDRWHFD